MSIKIGNVLHEADSEVVSLIHELHTDRERLQGRVALLENEAAKDLDCLKSQARRISDLEEMLKSYDLPH